MKLYSAPAFPVPSLDGVLSGFSAPDPLTRIRAAAQVLHPGFPLAAVSAHLPVLAGDVDPMVRRLAAIALGSGGTGFAGTLSSLVRQAEAEEVRAAAAHSLYRLKHCPDDALDGLAALLFSTTQSARQSAELALGWGGGARLGAIARALRAHPADQLNNQALSAFAAAARGQAGAAQQAVQWLRGILSGPVSPSVRMATWAALGSLTESREGIPDLLRLIEKGADAAQRREAMETLGSLGEQAASCRQPVVALLQRESDPECEQALYRLVVQLRTPPELLPLTFLRQRILQAPPPLATAACMVLSLGGASFASHADVLRARWGRDEQEMAMPLAITYEKITGGSIAPQD